MKIRTGFISNSSTSNFIVVGIDMCYNTRSKIEGLQEYLNDICNSRNEENLFEFSSGFGFIVDRLSEDVDDDDPEEFYKFHKRYNDNMFKAKENIEKIIDKFKLDEKKYKIKVFAGTFHT